MSTLLAFAGCDSGDPFTTGQRAIENLELSVRVGTEHYILSGPNELSPTWEPGVEREAPIPVQVFIVDSGDDAASDEQTVVDDDPRSQHSDDTPCDPLATPCSLPAELVDPATSHPVEPRHPADSWEPLPGHPGGSPSTTVVQTEDQQPCFTVEPSQIDFGTVVIGDRRVHELRVVSCSDEPVTIEELRLAVKPLVADDLSLDLEPAGLPGVASLEADGHLAVEVRPGSPVPIGLAYQPTVSTPAGETYLGQLTASDVDADLSFHVQLSGRAVKP